MKYEKFKSLVETHLLPMFPGSKTEEESYDPGQSALLVAQLGAGNRFALRPEVDSQYRVVVTRKQIFTHDERKIMDSFIWLLNEFKEIWSSKYLDGVLSDNTTRIIAHWLSANNESTIHNILKLFEEWAQQTYEGARISIIIGIDPLIPTKSEQIEQILREDFGKVLSNGIDSLLAVSGEGHLIEHKVVSAQNAMGFAPFRMLGIANWTSDGKYALCLNRNGEILIFGNGSLLFAKRRGIWRYLPHQSLIKQLAVGKKRAWPENVRSAVYESCLDASFARTGACVGIIKKTMAKKVEAIIEKNDFLIDGQSLKANVLKQLINKPFQSLPRQLRQELLAIDGAIVLDNKGTVITAGAILKIDPGSASGARRAAAIAIGKYGVGIKVSHDGVIQVFTESTKDEPIITIG